MLQAKLTAVQMPQQMAERGVVLDKGSLGQATSTLSLAVAILFSVTGATVKSCCRLFFPVPREYLTAGCVG